MRCFTPAALSCCTAAVKCFEQEIVILLILQMSKQKDGANGHKQQVSSTARRKNCSCLPPIPWSMGNDVPPRIISSASTDGAKILIASSSVFSTFFF